jgi:hypothetical protein
MSVLQSIERQDNKLSDLLLDHAVKPSDVTLTAILGLKDRVPSDGARERVPSPSPLAESAPVASTRAPKATQKRKPIKGTGRAVKSKTVVRKAAAKRRGIAVRRGAVKATTRPQRSTASPKAHRAATLPQRLSLAAVKRYLEAHDFRPVDNRSFGGGIWVLAPERRFAPVAKLLGGRGVKCKFFPAGTRQREERSSWLIDAFKRLS